MQRAVQNGNALFAERGATSAPQIGQIDMEKVIPRRAMSAIFLQTIERVTRALPGAFARVRRAPRPRATRGSRANEERVFPAASVIKIAVALEVLCAIEEGTLDASSRLTLREGDKVIGSGVLSALEPGLELPVARRALPRDGDQRQHGGEPAHRSRGHVGRERAAREASASSTTRLRGRIFVAGEDGERSPSTAAELVALLRAVHRAEGLPARACERLLALLARTQTASTIGRGLPDERFPRRRRDAAGDHARLQDGLARGRRRRGRRSSACPGRRTPSR